MITYLVNTSSRPSAIKLYHISGVSRTSVVAAFFSFFDVRFHGIQSSWQPLVCEMFFKMR
jgi:hypothetical protein